MLELDFLDRIREPDPSVDGSTLPCDALIVGTGAGGAAAAYELAAAGLDVIMVEEGDYLSARDYGQKTPLEALGILYRQGGLTFTMGNSPVLLPAGCCVGGTTVINSGTAIRALPASLERWGGEFGLRELVASLDVYYGRVERMLHVAPVEPDVFGRNGEIFRRGAGRAGNRGAILTRAERGCRGAGRCYLGCPNDAKQATNVSYVPQALRRGARLFVRTRAREILKEGGRATGVRATTRRGASVTFRADTIVLAAGAIFTPLLLADAHGPGRGLGRHLKVHPASRVVGEFDEEVRGWEGVPQGFHLEDTLAEGISVEGIFLPPALMGASLPKIGGPLREAMRRYNHLAMLGYRIMEDAEGRIFPRVFGFPRGWPIVGYRVARSDARRLARAAAISAEVLFSAGARRVYTAIRGFEVLGSPMELRRLREAEPPPADMELSGYHAQGTARLADSPERGVADPWGEVWGVPGLYVADASAMPSTPVSNPQLSIMALATHVAGGILARRGKRLADLEKASPPLVKEELSPSS